MPLWKVYHPTGSFSPEDKQDIAKQITSIYRMLPRFYVSVIFQEVGEDGFFVGGDRAGDVVRIWVDHIARAFSDDEMKARFLAACGQILAPFTSERGLRWEMHVDETPSSLWSIQDLRPPPPDSPGERRWKDENRASAFRIDEAGAG